MNRRSDDSGPIRPISKPGSEMREELLIRPKSDPGWLQLQGLPDGMPLVGGYATLKGRILPPSLSLDVSE